MRASDSCGRKTAKLKQNRQTKKNPGRSRESQGDRWPQNNQRARKSVQS